MQRFGPWFGMVLSKTLHDDDKIATKLRVKAEVTLSLKEDGPTLTTLKLSIASILQT